MKNKRILGLVTLAATTMFALTACGGNNAGSNAAADPVSEAAFPSTTSNTNTATIENGTLEVAVVTGSPFTGIFSPALSNSAIDTNFISPTATDSLFNVDPDTGRIIDGGAANFSLNQETGVATITVNDGVTWSDGTSVSSDDILFTYYLIANPDYTGPRFSDIIHVKGTEDYRNGKADSISGLKRVDDRTVEVTYTQVSPSLLHPGGSGGTMSMVVPAHQLKDIPVADLESSDEVRFNPLSFGPFYITNVVPGESVEMTRNPYFWGEKPQVETIITTALNPSTFVQAMEARQFDLAISTPVNDFPHFQNIEGYELLGTWGGSYSYLGFNLGTFDAENSVVVPDENAKMANVYLRRAMGHAIDQEALGESIFNGLRVPANVLLSPLAGDLRASTDEVPGFGHGDEIELANQILDEAGFEKDEATGFRNNPDGTPLEITFASMDGADFAEPLAQYHIQRWAEIGLNVSLLEGRLHDFTSFYDRIQADDPDIDVFLAAWSTGINPDPASLWGPNAAFNFVRYRSDEQDALIEAISSEEAFDEEYRTQAFVDWHKYAFENAFAIPQLFRFELTPVSKRVTNFSVGRAENPGAVWAGVGLTAESR